MGTRNRAIWCLLALGIAIGGIAFPVHAQEFRGRINGVVTDNSGAVLPGVSVTASSPALIRPQTATTGSDGTYRLIALPPGVYTITFELAGFKTVRHEGVRVVINQTLSVDGRMDVATLQETVTVTGESPVVDTSTNNVGTNFTKELLTEIPNARDIWAAMSQAPGINVTGYDVGGSHTGTQTGYITYGVSQQNTTRIEGINTTEGASANAGYFDFGSFEEFQIGGAGNGADADVPGAQLNITVKSGGDRFQGMWYSDWEGKDLISDNVPDALKTDGGRTDDGYFTPRALQRGNPIDRQYDLNGNVGGPIWRQKAWFFLSWRLNDQYKQVLNPDGSLFDTLAQSQLKNYTGKFTFQLSRSNQLIGYWNKRVKLQPLRDFGPSIPLPAAYYQASRNYPMKIEWTSVLSQRAFLDVLVGQWYNFFPLRPTWEGGFLEPFSVAPGRFETTTGDYTNLQDYYQDQKRYKPQVTASFSYFQEGWHGSHDFKVGFEGRRDRRKLMNDQPYNIFYRDTNGVPVEVDIYNGPVLGINDVNVRSFYLQDSWKFTNRLTLNLGFRVDRYTDGWPEQTHTPAGVPALANDPRFTSFFAPVTVEGRTVARTTTFGPRTGFAWDVRGDGRSVLKGFFGRFYFNSADIVADNENPVGAAQLRYRFQDGAGGLPRNGLVDGPAEVIGSAPLRTIGGAGFVKVDPNLKRPYGDEYSTHFEQELLTGLSARASYIFKAIRDDWSEVDVTRVSAYTVPFSAADIGPDGVRGTGDDRQLALLDLVRGTPATRMFTNPDDPPYNSGYQTFEVAINRRLRDRWMALTSFQYTWLNEFYGVTSSTSVLSSAGLSKSYLWRPNQRLFGDNGKEKTTQWNYKIIGRYELPLGIGVSGSYKLQSGRQWGRTISVGLTNAGTETVRVEPANARRAPNVGIFDIRLDKSFRLPARAGRITGILDVFNLTNTGTVTNFRITTGSRFQEVIALLDPRIIRLGLRYEF